MTKPIKILIYPNTILHEISSEVTPDDKAIPDLIKNMRIAMQCANGVGIAAVQLGVLKRIILITNTVMLNPEITEWSDEQQTVDEGCLSAPGVYDERERALNIRVKYLTENGTEKELDVEGPLAFCIQHEIDHLDGKLFLDQMSSLKKSRARRMIDKTLKKFKNDPIKVQVY